MIADLTFKSSDEKFPLIHMTQPVYCMVGPQGPNIQY